MDHEERDPNRQAADRLWDSFSMRWSTLYEAIANARDAGRQKAIEECAQIVLAAGFEGLTAKLRALSTDRAP
jgi:hypothetical protein